MPLHDYDIANQSGAAFRADINNVLSAIVTKNSSSTAPTTTFAYMWWLDTSGVNPILRIRNAANSAWIECGRVDLANFGINPTSVGTAAPSVPQAGQFWVDTSGPNPILKIRNVANNAWVDLGRVDVANLNALLKSGGTMTAAILFSNTDFTYVPVGTTAQRGSPSTGAMRYNSDLVQFEGYNGTAWAPIGGGGFTVSSVQNVSAGGTVTTSTTDQRQLRVVQGNAAAVDLSTTPFGAGGGWRDGTEILLIGNDDTNTVTLIASDVAKGVIGNFTRIEIGRGRTVELVWLASLDRWLVIGGF